jgi:hypothetical protein
VVVKTKQLLTVNRIDVIFKILHLKLKELGAPKTSDQIYNEHIKIITNGLYAEEGSIKNSLLDYVNEFQKIMNSIKLKGFDKTISKIPLAEDGTISNGSHRLAISVYLNIPNIEVEKTDDCRHVYDYSFFITRGISLNIMELIILEYLNLTENNYLAIIWPSADKTVNYLNEFNDIIYEKKIILNPLGAQNFVAQVYKEHEWVGSFEEGYGGAISKVTETFKDYSYLHLIFFKENSFAQVSFLKEKLRQSFGIKKGSVHISDNYNETLDIGKIVLNDNSIHFMKYGIPYKFPDIFNNLKLFREKLIKERVDISSVVISGETVLGIYGLKLCDTVQFLSKEELNLEPELFKNEIIYIKYFDEILEELIYNPKNYFYFSGFKFLTLDVIRKFKFNRKMYKDDLDLKLINKKNSLKDFSLRNHFLDLFHKYKFKFIGIIIPIAKKLKFYNIAKQLYKFFKLN